MKLIIALLSIIAPINLALGTDGSTLARIACIEFRSIHDDMRAYILAQPDAAELTSEIRQALALRAF